MGDFLNAAYKVLSSCKKPMTATEITQVALEVGLLHTEGQTPAQTMKSKLSTDILTNREHSQFMRTRAAQFALREWGDKWVEHHSARFKKSLFDEDILVVDTSALGNYIPTPGLLKTGINPQRLLDDSRAMRRQAAEEDLEVIQLVSVYIVSYLTRYLTYKRTKRLPEARLHGAYSMIFGGHLNPEDVPRLFIAKTPSAEILLDIVRELREELVLPHPPEVNFRGLLYDDSRDLSRQHIGIVYDVRMRAPEFQIGERGFLMDPKFESISEILSRESEFENWSTLIAKAELGNKP